MPKENEGSANLWTASKIVKDVRSKERSAREVTLHFLGEIAARDEDIHSFLEVLSDEALEAADALDAKICEGLDPGPLAGVPVALKDNLCTKGIKTTAGSKILEGWRPPYDAFVVSRIKDAGGIIIGKTNLDEFAMGSSTEHSAFGATKNPHDLSRVPGGSSGGSAAAVGAGFVPLALGSDTGGSIRQPAAHCGVVGMKPTYGAVSRYGLIAFASSLDQIGPFGQNVCDARLLFSVISGHDPMDSTSFVDPIDLDTGSNEIGVEGLRVGLCQELVDNADLEVRKAVHAAAASLEAQGANIIALSIPECSFGLSAYYLIAPAEASSNLARYDGVRYGLRVDAPDVTAMNRQTRTMGFGEEVKRRIMLGTFALSAGYYDAYYGQAQRVRTVVMRAFSKAYESVDVILGATSPTTAFALGDRMDDPMSMYFSDVCTIPSNLTGQPAISVPFGTDESGLPIGVQVLAPARGERQMFHVAQVLESCATKTEVSSS